MVFPQNKSSRPSPLDFKEELRTLIIFNLSRTHLVFVCASSFGVCRFPATDVQVKARHKLCPAPHCPHQALSKLFCESSVKAGPNSDSFNAARVSVATQGLS